MPRRYEDIYPSMPLMDSDAQEHVSAAAPMFVRCFQAPPDEMPEDIFAEHHLLLDLQERAHRVQNRRDGELHDLIFHKDKIVVTPAGMRSGWRRFDTSDVIVVTPDPVKVEKFARSELGILPDPQRFRDFPVFHEPELCAAGVMLRDALEDDDMTSGAMFEAMSRTVTFENEGAELTGTLYLPEGHDGSALPAVVVTGAWTSVEEQMPAVYAREMVERGFAAVTFDFSG
ncbi:hypothetical protein [Roseobacter ponti]|uniref:hypothetical protein n=1 Tax=Roseobacter ponti TaxID=1891787 RepID=UPI001FE79216|nr:hypothetical protein [Roseobacter ponti]